MLKYIDPDTALNLVLSETKRARAQSVPLLDALGRVAAESVFADRDYPPFDRAMMDGYAVQVADAGKLVAVVGEVAAGRTPSQSLRPGTCVAIMTGAACPEGTEAVVEKERIQVQGDTVLLPPNIARDHHVARRGEEQSKGAVVFERDAEITPLAISVLASVGVRRISVFAPPRLAVITTGQELVFDDAQPGENTIRDSNGAMLAAQIKLLGLKEPLLLHAEDSLESLATAIEQASKMEIVVFTGGVSMGRFDLVPQAVSDFGASIVFHKVSQQPGKPLLFAKTDEHLIFGLPGNPLSSYLCFHRYVSCAIKKMMGKPFSQRYGRARLARDLVARSDRTLFVNGRVEKHDDGWLLTPRSRGSSANHFSAIDCNAYVRMPPGQHRLEADTEVIFEWTEGYPR